MFETGPLAGRWLEVSGSGQVHPQVVRNMGFDPERVHRLRLRLGHRPAGDAALRHRRPAPVLRRRPALPAPVRLTRRRRRSCNSPNPGCASSAIRRSSTRRARRAAHHGRPRGRGRCARSRRRSTASSSPRCCRSRTHPNADRLRVCQVDAGAGATLLDRLRRAERARRHQGAAARWSAPSCRRRRGRASRFAIERRQAARRREPRHAVLGARAEALRRPRRPARSSTTRAVGADVRAGARARRHDLHAQAHAQPRPLRSASTASRARSRR